MGHALFTNWRFGTFVIACALPLVSSPTPCFWQFTRERALLATTRFTSKITKSKNILKTFSLPAQDNDKCFCFVFILRDFLPILFLFYTALVY